MLRPGPGFMGTAPPVPCRARPGRGNPSRASFGAGPGPRAPLRGSYRARPRSVTELRSVTKLRAVFQGSAPEPSRLRPPCATAGVGSTPGRAGPAAARQTGAPPHPPPPSEARGRAPVNRARGGATDP
ncbi:hypothetical protein GCM10010381_17590 [Streptomyces xantholiticus]|nr:hypothetical protein GCM10010381_17590 [Streptomyces xantholiticus]